MSELPSPPPPAAGNQYGAEHAAAKKAVALAARLCKVISRFFPLLFLSMISFGIEMDEVLHGLLVVLAVAIDLGFCLPDLEMKISD